MHGYTSSPLYIHVILLSLSASAWGQKWPLQPKQYDSRPPGDTRCPAKIVPFCAPGGKANFMPTVPENDTFYLYIMRAPENDTELASITSHFALGFHHVETGLNMTLEWYELSNLYNCTFPTEDKDKKLEWCNQGATCLSMGIDKSKWTKPGGVLTKVGEITGDIFNQFANWTEKDNNTYPFVNSWTVMLAKGTAPWFEAVDRPGWLIRALRALHSFGAEFNTTNSPPLTYPKVVLYGTQPQSLGDGSGHMEAITNFLQAYAEFPTFVSVLSKMLSDPKWCHSNDAFYIFYNEQFWRFYLVNFAFGSPPVAVVQEDLPIPG